MEIELRDYQKEAIQKVKENKGRLLLSLPPGAGKTWTSLFLKQQYSFIQHVLVVCPSSIKYQWASEIHKIHPADSIQILTGHYDTRWKEDLDSVFDKDWIIINYEILSEANPKKPTWADVLSRLQFDLLIVDESHYITNPEAIRTKAVQKVASKIKNRVLLSGTPLTKNLEDLYTQLNLIDPVQFPTAKEYKDKYCTYVLKKIHARGKTIRFNELQPPTQDQINKLKEDMKNDVYSVSKSTVFASLPETTYQLVPCYLEDDDFEEMVDIMCGEDIKKAKETFAYLMESIGSRKVEPTINFCKQLNEIDGRKICIVAYNRSIVEELHEKLNDSSVFFYGGIKEEEKRKAVSEFINNPKIKFFIMNCNTITGLDGLNTVCSTIVFCQIPYTWAAYDQCVGRIKRTNSTFDKYFAYTMLAENGCDLDKAVYNTMMERKNVTESLFDNAVETSKMEQSFIRDVLRRVKR